MTPWLNSVPAGCNRGEFNHVDFAISEAHLEYTIESGIYTPNGHGVTRLRDFLSSKLMQRKEWFAVPRCLLVNSKQLMTKLIERFVEGGLRCTRARRDIRRTSVGKGLGQDFA